MRRLFCPEIDVINCKSNFDKCHKVSRLSLSVNLLSIALKRVNICFRVIFQRLWLGLLFASPLMAELGGHLRTLLSVFYAILKWWFKARGQFVTLTKRVVHLSFYWTVNRDIAFHAQWLALLKSLAIFLSQSKAKAKTFLASSRLDWNEHVFETHSRNIIVDTVLNPGKPRVFSRQVLAACVWVAFWLALLIFNVGCDWPNHDFPFRFCQLKSSPSMILHCSIFYCFTASLKILCLKRRWTFSLHRNRGDQSQTQRPRHM